MKREVFSKLEGAMKLIYKKQTIFYFIFATIILGGAFFIIYPGIANSVRKINAFNEGSVFFDWGEQYWFGDGKKQDYTLAVFNFKLAAEKGNVHATAFLGDAFLYGKGVEIDYTKAFQYYLKGADAGDAWAQIGLSTMYLEGYSIPRDLDKAVFWAQKAADQNVPQGWYSLAICYLAYHDAEKDKKAFQIFKKLSETNVAAAYIELADCYLDGIGTAKNVRKAEVWYRKALLSDPDSVTSAKISLAQIYIHNTEFKDKIPLAIQYLTETAEEDNYDAQYELAICYRDGIGVEKSHNKMLYYLKKAAAAGEQPAINELKKYEK